MGLLVLSLTPTAFDRTSEFGRDATYCSHLTTGCVSDHSLNRLERINENISNLQSEHVYMQNSHITTVCISHVFNFL